GERERNRARGGVPVPVDVDDHALARDAELLDSVIHDPHVRLVRHVDVDVVDGHVAFVEYRLRGRNEHAGRELEHLAPGHVDVTIGPRIPHPARATTREGQVDTAAAVGAELEA